MMRVRIVASDSMGVRSMATVVEACGFKVFVDPGASLAPRRYGLPPHPLEVERLQKVKERVAGELADSDIVIVTHYHYDHYLYEPEYSELYKGKTLLVKHPTRSINFSQRMRAYRFLKRNRVEEHAASIGYLDGATHRFGDLVVEASPPVPHGAEGSKLGYVVMVKIACGDEAFIHASDVQGPIAGSTLSWLLAQSPGASALFISGPPTYFAGFKVPREEVERGLANLRRLAAEGPPTVIADHHMARDIGYPQLLRSLSPGPGRRLVSAAEYMGAPYEPLEALRKRLWREHPPDSG